MTGAPAQTPEAPAKASRCGFVALIGEPNAGKSTLLNAMVGSKVSIVTHKAQTTRARIRGVAIHDRSQIVFVDTPGLFPPRRRLDRAMVASAWAGAGDADIVVLMVEAHRGVTSGVEAVLDAMSGRLPESASVALAINKIDRVRRNNLLALSADLNARRDFAATFMISAEKGHGIADLKAWLAERLPEGPWHYPEGEISDLPVRLLAAEITREKLTLRLHKELPYQLTVETERWEEMDNGDARIEQVIYVARDGHKGIVLGRNGGTIGAIGAEARKDISKLIGRGAHLFLTVKARPGWWNERERYAHMGLEFGPGSAS